jgi:hypothetical protein
LNGSIRMRRDGNSLLAQAVHLMGSWEVWSWEMRDVFQLTDEGTRNACLYV